MRVLNSILSIVVLAGTGIAQPAKAPSFLPTQFAGWQLKGQRSVSKDPAVADPTNGVVLKEYGFSDLESATYVRDDGRQLTLKAARFADATGAYGAFTFYNVPPMIAEKIGDDAASLNDRVLFYRGNILVDAVFSKLSAMSAAELRELASVLPRPSNSDGNLPSLPGYLPKQSYEKSTMKYVVGPAALEKVGSPMPADLVDFKAGAELVFARYTGAAGSGTLTLISYPTPQIATEHLKRIEATQNGNSAAAPTADKRTGPIVAVVSGPFSRSEAQSLLGSVNYDADVTWNQNTYVDKRNNLANLLVNVIWLCAILVGLMLVAGLAFGGIRIFLGKLLPNRMSGGTEQVDFISLNLSDEGQGSGNSRVSSSIKVV
jgi:hypothetical protein